MSVQEFDYGICKLDDNWLDFHINKYTEAKTYYEKSLSAYREINKPIQEPIRVAEYLIGENTPYELAHLYNLIDTYIQESQEDNKWEFSHITHESVDYNTDPYEDYTDMRMEIHVYAVVLDKSKLVDTKVVREHYESVVHAEKVLINCKKHLMEYLKGEYNR